MADELRARLAELGIADLAVLRGYVQHGAELREAYDSSDVLLHVSWTEGLPQVILEAFAARLPVVATDVGGIGAAVGGATVLIPPGAVDAAVAALRRVKDSPELRAGLMEAGTEYAHEHSTEAEIQKLLSFMGEERDEAPALAAAGTGGGPGR